VTSLPSAERVSGALDGFTRWLCDFGETSFDHQSFFAGPVGGRAKALYYRQRKLGTLAVAPMVFFEAFVPSARRLFHRRLRFPIADAHYAMGFAFLREATGDDHYLETARHFLEELKNSRCPGYDDYCWGYPFDWVTRNGTLPGHTPFITSTPYVYEAFLQVHTIQPRDEWLAILASIARHVQNDIKDTPTSASASSSSYGPYGGAGVINASAYRAFMLTSAARVLCDERYRVTAERNLNFVLEAQNGDGSWHYAIDGVRDFIDHFHTCFVMKALGKILRLTGHSGCRSALERGVRYYLGHLFDEEGRPKPFSRAPRMIVYKRELYDCAECINLCLVLRSYFPELNETLERVVRDILDHWVKRDGSFRSRRLYFGWDNVPMHRWAQAQMFRSLAYYVREASADAPD